MCSQLRIHIERTFGILVGIFVVPRAFSAKITVDGFSFFFLLTAKWAIFWSPMKFSTPHCTQIILAAIRFDYISTYSLSSVITKKKYYLILVSTFILFLFLYRLHNFIITRNLKDASFRHERAPNWQDSIILAQPSAVDGDAHGEALDDPRFETEPVLPDDIPDEQSSAFGTSVRRAALLTRSTTMDLQRPATSRRPRASDIKL
jgi:hypothetical protein